jgi:hypothetical protein
MIHWGSFQNERNAINRKRNEEQARLPKLRTAVANAVAEFNKNAAIQKQKVDEYEWLAQQPAHTGEDELKRMNLKDQITSWVDKTTKSRQAVANLKGALKECESILKYSATLDDVTEESWDNMRFPVEPKNKSLMLALAYGVRERLHFMVILRQETRKMLELNLARAKKDRRPEYAESISLDSDESVIDEITNQIGRVCDEIQELTTLSYHYKAMTSILEKQLSKEELHFFKVGGKPRTTHEMRAAWDAKALERAAKRAKEAQEASKATIDFEDIS